jgi:hypothetical protein
VSSSRYIYDPLLPALHKIFLQIFFYIYALIRMDVNKHMHISREREREHTERPKETKGEILSLVARGKRSLHVCARP